MHALPFALCRGRDGNGLYLLPSSSLLLSSSSSSSPSAFARLLFARVLCRPHGVRAHGVCVCCRARSRTCASGSRRWSASWARSTARAPYLYTRRRCATPTSSSPSGRCARAVPHSLLRLASFHLLRVASQRHRTATTTAYLPPPAVTQTNHRVCHVTAHRSRPRASPHCTATHCDCDCDCD